MGRIFVWEKSQRAGMALVFQPALYAEMPHDGNGMKETDGRFVLVHQEREDETEWGLMRFCETYPCPASRQIKIGKDKYASEPTQTRQDIDETQTRERVARHLDRTVDSGGNGGSTTTHDNQENERPTQDQCGHNTERTGSNGSETQSTEVHSTGEGSSQDGLASNNGDIQMSYKKTVCLDFDSVVHSYKSGWKGYDVIPDPIVDGAITFMLTMLAAGWDVCIHSSRSHEVGGMSHMHAWLKKEAGNAWYESPAGPGIEDVRFVENKPPAILYIDDRGWKFEGVFPTKEFCENFRSWVQPGFAG